MLKVNTAFAALIILLTWGGPNPKNSQKKFGVKEKFSYALAVTIVGSSPILGGIIADYFGFDLDFGYALIFAAIPILLSLPISLLVSRIFGREVYGSYWEYLLAFSETTKKSLAFTVLAASIGVFAFGVILRL